MSERGTSENSLVERVDEQMFSGVSGTLSSHLRRKRVVSEPLRFAILYTVVKRGSVSRVELEGLVQVSPSEVEYSMESLLAVRVVEEVEGSEGVVYRATNVGERLIAGDEELVGGV